MIRLAADENLNGDLVRGVMRREPRIDLVRVQDVGLSGASDPVILDWAAREGRVLLTHDVSTMVVHVRQRLQAGQPMPGVFEVPLSLPLGRGIDDIVLVAVASIEGEWEGQVRFLPL